MPLVQPRIFDLSAHPSSEQKPEEVKDALSQRNRRVDAKQNGSFSKKVLGGSLVALTCLCGAALPFIYVRRGAPFVPSTPAARRAVLAHCRALSAARDARSPPLRLVDLGSGAGGLVFDAGRAGLCARGVERNPILVAFCRAEAMRRGLRREQVGDVQFLWADMWDVGSVSRRDDVVVVFGVPGIMESVARKLELEMRPQSKGEGAAWLVSNTFEVPGWRKEKTAAGVHFYRRP